VTDPGEEREAERATYLNQYLQNRPSQQPIIACVVDDSLQLGQEFDMVALEALQKAYRTLHLNQVHSGQVHLA